MDVCNGATPQAIVSNKGRCQRHHVGLCVLKLELAAAEKCEEVQL